MEVQAGGALLRLLPQRAAYLPAQQTLLVADGHLGKAVSFRRLGVPVPEANTDALPGTCTRRPSLAVAAGTGCACPAFTSVPWSACCRPSAPSPACT